MVHEDSSNRTEIENVNEYLAKKSKKKEDEPQKVVAKCDNPYEVVAKCDQLTVYSQFEVANGDRKKIHIESLIRVIRGQKVMLDSDLAMLYGVTTSRLNEQVKRNINRFPDDFMFQLTKEEWSALRSQIVTLEDLTSQIATLKGGRGQHRKFLPYVFTRNGIGMLSSVLRSETAVEVNIRIMRAITAIPEIVNNNVLMMQRILNIEQHQTETDEKVNQIITTIEERIPKQLPEHFARHDTPTFEIDNVKNCLAKQWE